MSIIDDRERERERNYHHREDHDKFIYILYLQCIYKGMDIVAIESVSETFFLIWNNLLIFQVDLFYSYRDIDFC